MRKEIEDTSMHEILSIVGHELKTPVTSIKAYTSILEKRLNKRKDLRNMYFLNHINEQADRITLLVNRILDANRIESGAFAMQSIAFDIDKLLSKLVIDFQHMTDSHHIVLEGDTLGKIKGDPERIREVVINLLTNAIKYSSKTKQIKIQKKYHKDFVSISVKDFGIGIPKNMQEQIFERNFQINTKGDSSRISSGLGLYIASEIIKRHKGTISVESKRGKGSTFTFTLPHS